MDEAYRNKARGFLRKEIAPRYNALGGFANVEVWARGYKGEHKDFLEKVINYFQIKNSSANSSFFGISEMDIETILEEIIPQSAF